MGHQRLRGGAGAGEKTADQRTTSVQGFFIVTISERLWKVKSECSV